MTTSNSKTGEPVELDGVRIETRVVDDLLAQYQGREVTLTLSQLGYIVPKDRKFSALLSEASCTLLDPDAETYRLHLGFVGFGIEMTDSAVDATITPHGLWLSFGAGDALLCLSSEENVSRELV